MVEVPRRLLIMMSDVLAKQVRDCRSVIYRSIIVIYMYLKEHSITI